MNNEIGRKLTSLTLMTIMLAAGFTAFAPSTMQTAAAANANLFVSAENSQFQNHFAGPMVIEVVVIDSDIKDTDEAKGEPDVTVNGNKLRMAQATDGNWYGYFADRKQALIADAVALDNGLGTLNGTGLDFGVFCSPSSTAFGPTFTQTVGIALARQPNNGGIQGTLNTETQNPISSTCTGTTSTTTPGLQNNVVRENKTLNHGGTGVSIGQISVTQSNFWPVIQLYNFNPTGNVVVQYNKGGGVQSTTLKFDTVDQFAKLELDRATYPRSAQVHVTITDVQLNIDPTDEDSWTFGTNSANKTTFYSVFTEDGALAKSGQSGPVISRALTGNLTSLMFEDNGRLILNKGTQGATIIQIQDNADTNMTGTDGFINAGKSTITAASQPVTITETAPNTGIFGTYDEDDKSVVAIRSDAPRGKSATIDYNEVGKTILVGFGFASVDIRPTDAEWTSGEEIPVVLTDSDANKNSRADEDLDLNNPDVDLIPSLRIGNPFTLGANGTEVDVNKVRYSAILAKSFTTYQAGHMGLRTDGNFTDIYMSGSIAYHDVNVNKFSDRAIINIDTSNNNGRQDVRGLLVTYGKTVGDLKKVVKSTNSTETSSVKRLHGFDLFNYDIRGLSNSTISGVNGSLAIVQTGATRMITTGNTADRFWAVSMFNGSDSQGLINLNKTVGTNTRVIDRLYGLNDNTIVGAFFAFDPADFPVGKDAPIVADFFSFGYMNDGFTKADRLNNAIYRIEAEETGDNTSVFEGSLEFVMLNQLNILDADTYTGLSTIAEDPTFVVHQDLDDEESPRVNYNDLGADGVVTQVADQQAAPTHSGVVSFDKPTYKIADTVVVTLEDQDLNVDSDLIDIYTVVNSTGDVADNLVGKAGLPKLSNGDLLGRLLDITFDDRTWVDNNDACITQLRNAGIDASLEATGFTLIETGVETGIFTGDFQVPSKVCRPDDSQTGQSKDTSPVNTQGFDMEVNYLDFRDASGQIVEVGDGAGIRANTGSVSLDRTVYPVPWGDIEDFASSTANDAAGRSIFPIHLTGIGTNGVGADETLGDGILTIHVQVNDPDFDTSASGEDRIAQIVAGSDGDGDGIGRGPVKITVSRGQNSVILGYAGGDTARNGVIIIGNNATSNAGIEGARDLGPIIETAPTSGIFEFDLDIQYTDGPASSTCPDTATYDSLVTPGTTSGSVFQRFNTAVPSGSTDYCILQGDIITVEYTDPADASGDVNTVTDSATFDLRNGALQSDKSVYIIGSDMILTLIEPDFDLDNDLAETYDLDLIEWDSDAATTTMGNKGVTGAFAAFDPEPSDLRETGDSTGIFQVVIEIPKVLNNDSLERGEEIVLEYTDWGPSGADFVGQEDEDINLTIFTSNFGATVELDQKVYTWTDKVYITIVAPDHNFDSNLIDEIGETTSDPIKVATRGHDINRYKLVETGTDTGIFTGEVILTGFAHDADGDGTNDAPTQNDSADGTGPTDGFLGADDDDGLTVSFEFSEDETVVGSALIRWNIGEVTWLEASYPASGTGVVRVIDPDMNLNPEAVDNFEVDVWSDSDAGGIDLTVTETNEATGIFEGTVFFTTTDSSSGHRLRVAEGDTVTAEYQDNTLPDPYTTADELDITGTAFIGTVVPPLERAPASNARVVDAFGNTLDEVSVDQQVQITADLTNGQDREQPFAYLVQIQDEDGVTVSLAWITGSLAAGQSFSPALSWTPTAAGTYTATVFVWESVDNPTALSPTVEVTIDVS